MAVAKKPTTMPPDIRRRLFDVRCRSKSGQALSADDTAFFKECFAKWPEEYAAMNKDVFEATKPVGAQ